MLNIVSIGHAYPETVLDNDYLSTLPGAPSADEILNSFGIESRYSSLSKEYISETFNSSTSEAKKQALQTPTDLGVKAAEMALKNANLTWEDIGLIIGDGTTPVQTTPGESQRVGNASGLKIPAYDIYTPSASFALHCNLLNSWKEERIPKYVLSVSSHTPTQLVNYSEGHERFVFGDGASVVIYSASEPGIFTVEDAFYDTDVSKGTFIRFNILGHAHLDRKTIMPLVVGRTVELYQKCIEKNGVESAKALFSSIDGVALDSTSTELGLTEDQIIASINTNGNVLSASVGCALSAQLDSLESGQQIVCGLAEGAVSFGYVLLRKN